MEKPYDNFVKDIGLYKKMGEEERLIFQMARLFGECEVNVPPGFVKEVLNYIGKWNLQASSRKAIHSCKFKIIIRPSITKAMMDNNWHPILLLGIKGKRFRSSLAVDQRP